MLLRPMECHSTSLKQHLKCFSDRAIRNSEADKGAEMKTNQALMNSMMILGTVSVLASGAAEAQTRARRFVPFKQFLEQTRSTAAADTAVEEMRQHVLSRYEDVQVRH